MRSLARVVAVTLAGFAFLAVVHPPAVLDHDTFRDLLLARECLDGVACVTHGPRAGLGGYLQGAVWIWFLVAMRGLALPPDAWETVVCLPIALASALMLEAALRLRVSWGMAVVAAAAVLAGNMLLIPLGVLHNPTLLPLPLALFMAAAVGWAITQRTPFAVVAGLALGVSLDTHGIAVALLPGFLLLLVSVRRSFVDPLLGAAFAIPAIMWSVSREAFESNVDTALRTGLAVPGAFGLLALGAFAFFAVRPRLMRRTPRQRGWIAVAILGGSALFGNLGLSAYYGEEVLPYYYMPAVPGAALLLVGAVDLAWRALTRRMPAGLRGPIRVAVPVVLAVPLAVAARPLGPELMPFGWTMAELGSVSADLNEAGYAYQDGFVHVFGFHRREIVAAMAALEPMPRSGPPEVERDVVVVPTWTPESAPEDQRVPLAGGRWALRDFVDPWIERDSGTVCYGPLDGPPPGSASDECVVASVVPPGPAISHPVHFESRALPYLADIEIAAADGALTLTHEGGTLVWWEFPIVPSEAGERRYVVDTRPSERPGCEWRISAVEGLEFEGTLPAITVVVRADGASSGMIRAQREYGVRDCRRDVPQFTPDLIEIPVDPRWEAIAEILVRESAVQPRDTAE